MFSIILCSNVFGADVDLYLRQEFKKLQERVKKLEDQLAQERLYRQKNLFLQEQRSWERQATVEGEAAARKGGDQLNESERIQKGENLFVRSKKHNRFHYSYCKYAREIDPSDIEFFISAKEALDAGYIPCSYCNPSPETDTADIAGEMNEAGDESRVKDLNSEEFRVEELIIDNGW